MGTGVYGGFGNTDGFQNVDANHSNRIFHAVQFEGTVKVNNVSYDVSRRVYQRNDIDFDYYDANTGQTNLERMKAGKAPIGNDGSPIQLHHVIQKETGPVVEIREVTHVEYSKTLHGLVESGISFRNDPLLKKQYNISDLSTGNGVHDNTRRGKRNDGRNFESHPSI